MWTHDWFYNGGGREGVREINRFKIPQWGGKGSIPKLCSFSKSFLLLWGPAGRVGHSAHCSCPHVGLKRWTQTPIYFMPSPLHTSENFKWLFKNQHISFFNLPLNFTLWMIVTICIHIFCECFWHKLLICPYFLPWAISLKWDNV